MTQEFHISVTPVGNDDYLVRTERVAPGVPLAEEQVRWSVDEWLAQARQLMSDPLLELLQSERSPDQSRISASSLRLVELGQTLYGALFYGTLRDSWVTAQGIAQHRREALRLRLGLKGNRLPRLPWEVLYGTDVPIEQLRQGIGSVPRPLTVGTHVIFSRYQPGTRIAEDSAAPLVEANQPLRILMVIAAPTDQQQLELHREAAQLQRELTSPGAETTGASPETQLTVLDHPGREQLTQALEQGQYHVLHYAGHSNLGTAGGSLYLVNNRTGLTEILSGDDLAGLLVNNGVRLAVFNSCRGAYTAADPVNERERNLAEALVSRGIPAVLAMAEQIPDNVALTLTWLFYRNLKQGYPIDLSLSRARQGLISTYGSHQFYWALPILYLHPEFDGYLLSHALDNPADRLLLTPQSYTIPALAAEVALSPEPAPLPSQADALIARSEWSEFAESEFAESEFAESEFAATGGEWADDLEDPDLEDAEEDASVVADLLRQLTPVDAPDPAAVPTSATGSAITHLSELGITHREMPVAAPRSHEPNLPNKPPRNITQPPGRAHRQPLKQDYRRMLLPLAGAIGSVAIAFIGYSVLPSVLTRSSEPSAPVSSSEGVADPVPTTTSSLSDRSVTDVKALAVNNFRQKQFTQGQQAVAELLDRGALNEAAEALQAVPSDRLDQPAFSYLQGRLAWQAANQGNPNYSIDQARTAWETAVQKNPDVSAYHEALGFAYYAENKPAEAIETWFRSLSAPQRQATETAATTQSAPLPSDNLTTQAGIALALWKTSNQQPPELQEKYESKAIEMYKRVVASDPAHFQPTALSQSWLWNSAAVQDWQTLSQTVAK